MGERRATRSAPSWAVLVEGLAVVRGDQAAALRQTVKW